MRETSINTHDNYHVKLKITIFAGTGMSSNGNRYNNEQGCFLGTKDEFWMVLLLLARSSQYSGDLP